ncbi:MAG: response regulator [Leptolyngbyaceae cyanobacterium SM2_5_2]|nr:response regulator [Leptolyngbyaceae cyanobacterium SM2_5_2]
MGLSISRCLVQLMGGDISVDSRWGDGSTFSFTIPVGLVSQEEILGCASEAQVVSLQANQESYRILIVDDQSENRLLLARLLSPIGVHIQEAATGEAALQIWQQWQPHLIWMDIRLPGLNGYEVTQRIRAQEQQQNGHHHNGHYPNSRQASPTLNQPTSPPPTVIIALTAQAFPEDRALALAAGCNDYITKPFSTETLLRKMAEHLGLPLIYAEDSANGGCRTPPITSQAADGRRLTMNDLAGMPPAWITELQKAAQIGRDEAVKTLIHQIPREQVGLIDKLQALIYDFEFGLISDVAELWLQSTSTRQ